MSSFVPLVPHTKQSGARSGSFGLACAPAFNTPVRWTLRVLAWLAFGIASYLAWSALTQTAVAGCSVGSHEGCDLVLTSSWSKWLDIPVAVLGLACYAALATLSVLLGLRSVQANRWISTMFVMLSIAAAGVSLWFVGIQVFALGSYCPYCLVTDSCGIALGVIATVFAVRSVYTQCGSPRSPAVQPGLMALRTTMPVGNRTAPLAVRTEPSTPWLLPAIAGAIPLIGLLIGGQLLFVSKTYDLQKVALNDSIQMVGSKGDTTKSTSSNGTERVAMRVPSEDEGNVRPSLTTDPANPNAKSDASAKDNSAGAQEKSAAEPTEPTKKRLMKFLGGKLTLDIYQHPVIGSPEAPHIAIEMVSYDCPHCRKMYPIMEHALERYGDQVALLIMIQPLDKDCNKLVTDPAASHPGACTTAKLVMGVARINPSSFATFHDFLMSTKDKPPAMATVLPKAYVLADRSRLRQLTQSDEITKQLEGYVDLFGTLQKQSGKKDFGLPVQILGDHVMSGSVESEADVFKAWEEHLGMKPK
jgi:uncharacterized membrane protein/thiol-disulfide isomerase/thioredoxin